MQDESMPQAMPTVARPGIAPGPVWSSEQPSFVVKCRANPNRGSKFSGIKQFTTYDIESSGLFLEIR